jgi:hypothetical protein
LGFTFPPGIAENPLLFVAPVLGEFHKEVDFNSPPEVNEPEKLLFKKVISLSLGICQPKGQIP